MLAAPEYPHHPDQYPVFSQEELGGVQQFWGDVPKTAVLVQGNLTNCDGDTYDVFSVPPDTLDEPVSDGRAVSIGPVPQSDAEGFTLIKLQRVDGWRKTFPEHVGPVIFDKPNDN
jgi:hypothetical protein